MSYREILIDLSQEQTEEVSEVLFSMEGVLSITVEDAQAGKDTEQALFGEPGMEPDMQAWLKSRMVILIDNQTDPVTLIDHATKILGDNFPPPSGYKVRLLEEQDWVSLTQSQFSPIAIGKRIWVIPSWHKTTTTIAEDAIVLALDPGLAFGTGSHPTTSLCMEWLESHLHGGESVLDYGCGSGILSIVADKLGAAKVIGVDIDSNAITTARDNAIRNQAPSIELLLPEALPAIQFDVVVANILSNPLKLMAGMLSAKVKVGGYLALCGILTRQAEEVAASYAPWITLHSWQNRDGWTCLTGKKAS